MSKLIENAFDMTNLLLSQVENKTVRDEFKMNLKSAVETNDYLIVSKVRDNVIRYIDENNMKKQQQATNEGLKFKAVSFEFLKLLCPDILSLPNLPEYYTEIEKAGVFPKEEAKKWNKTNGEGKRKAIHVQTIVKKDMIIASADPQLGKTKFTICLAIKSLIEGRVPIIVTRALNGDMYKLLKDIENVLKLFYEHMAKNNINNKIKIKAICADSKEIILESNTIIISLGNECQLARVYNAVKDKHSTYDILIDEIDSVDYGNDTKTLKVLTKLKEEAYQPFGITATPLDALCSEKELKSANMVRLKRPDDYRGFIDFQVKLLTRDPKTVGLSKAKSYDEILESDGNLEPFIRWFSKKLPDWSWNNKRYYPRICLFKISHIIVNQDQIYEGMLRDYGDDFVVIVYNGEGIRMNYKGMGNININGKSVVPGEYVEILIPDVLQYLKDNGGEKKFPRIAIISGKLAGRCTSYVSRDYDWHLTDMYYNPSKSTPIPEMIQSAGRLCGLNRGKAPNLLLHTTKKVSEALYEGFHFTNEVISRAIASPLMESGKEVSFKNSILSVPMNNKKFPKGRNMTSKVKVKKSEFNLVKKDDGGVDIEEYKYTEFNEKKKNNTKVGNCKLIIMENLGNISKEYYEKIVKYLKENKNKWFTKSECISNISTDKNESNIIMSTTWVWHSKDNVLYNKNVNEKCKGLLFKIESNTWYIRYN